MKTRDSLVGSFAEHIKAIPEERWAYLQYQNDISDQIAVFMNNHSVSKAELARRLNTSRAYVTKVLRGNANMTMETFVSLLFALGTKPVTRIISKDEHEQECADIDGRWVLYVNRQQAEQPVAWHETTHRILARKEESYEYCAA